MPRLVTLSLALLIATQLVIPAQVPAEQRAIDEMKTTVDAVLEVLKDKTSPTEQRRQRIRQLVRERFEFELMSQSTLGRHWKNATPEEKTTFIELYSKLLEANYIGHLEEYTNEKVKFNGEKVRGDKALVETTIMTASTEIPIDYKLVQTASGWKVYDVRIENSSLTRNFRNTYGSIVDNEGFAGLFTQMEAKVKELEH